jgi:hypothetical protein
VVSYSLDSNYLGIFLFIGGIIMGRMTTTELVNKVFAFCEAYSGVAFFPYQAQFAKRIIRSVLENDGDEITALFSRQCLEENQLVLMSDWTKKPIKDVKIGDIVKAFDYDGFVDSVVVDSYCAGRRDVYKLELKSGKTILTTANHRFLDGSSRLFKPLADFEAGDTIAYKNSKGKVKLSRIKNIRHIGEKMTYDIEVEGTENFVCSDILCHNSGKSETVATVSGGLAIILPILANFPMFANDDRLSGFKNGLMIGIFAPTLNQAQISFGRMKKRMGSKSAQEVMSDPEVNVSFQISNGQNIILDNGSLIRCQSASEGSNIEGDSYMVIIVDEAQDVTNFKYLKSISPMGAFYNATKILIGTATTQKGFFFESIARNEMSHKEGGRRNHFEYDYNTVIKYNPKYEKYVAGEKKRLGENSDEFRMSYRLQWILERGMFFDPALFDELREPNMSVSLMDTSKVHVAGIDLGKKSDSTVVTILEVDWDNPIIAETSNEADIPDFIAYHMYIKAWLELQGDDWEEQYPQIMDFLANFNVARVVMDATGVGDAIYDRMRANLNYEVIPYVFSKQSKSELYKHLNTEVRAKRLHYPADEFTTSQREYPSFVQQCLDLEKSWSGQLLVVAHPDVRGAHDDYPDSLALAVWGAKGEGVSRPVTERNAMYQRTGKGFRQSANRLTGKRR